MIYKISLGGNYIEEIDDLYAALCKRMPEHIWHRDEFHIKEDNWYEVYTYVESDGADYVNSIAKRMGDIKKSLGIGLEDEACDQLWLACKFGGADPEWLKVRKELSNEAHKRYMEKRCLAQSS